MTVGEINKGVVALILALVLGAGGYLWYSKMYKPAVAAKTVALAAATTAETDLAGAKQRLEQATQALEESKKEVSKLDDSVSRLAKARTAIPNRKLIDDATIFLLDQAQKSGVQTGIKAGDEGDDNLQASVTTGATGGLQGATPIEITFKAAGTYGEMMNFMDLVENSVEVKDNTLYTRGRLFNVVKLKIGKEDDNDSGGTTAFGGSSDSAENAEMKFDLGKNDMIFEVTVRMYMSTTSNAADVGSLTPDPAAAATTDTTGAGGTGTTDPSGATGSATTDPSAGGAGGAGGTGTTDPAAGGAAGTGTTDPAAGGATGATDTGAAATSPTTTAGGI